MTLNTIAADGANPTYYWVSNLVTGETIELRPSSGGQFFDYPMGQRFGHQLPPFPGMAGVASWRLGTRSTFVVLSSADIASLYSPVNTFGSSGSLGAPVWLASADERTLIQQNNRAGNFGASPTPQLEIRQGSNSVYLTQQNAADLAATLQTIGAT